MAQLAALIQASTDSILLYPILLYPLRFYSITCIHHFYSILFYTSIYSILFVSIRPSNRFLYIRPSTRLHSTHSGEHRGYTIISYSIHPGERLVYPIPFDSFRRASIISYSIRFLQASIEETLLRVRPDSYDPAGNEVFG